jgi:hypothetical protein
MVHTRTARGHGAVHKELLTSTFEIQYSLFKRNIEHPISNDEGLFVQPHSILVRMCAKCVRREDAKSGEDEVGFHHGRLPCWWLGEPADGIKLFRQKESKQQVC